jgi:cytochrome b subunit of formate dehydrogenase
MISRSKPKQTATAKLAKRPGLLGILDVLSKLAYLVGLLSFSALLFTGFFPCLVLGHSISGYWLMVHVSSGGVFMVCLAFLTVMFAERCRFGKSDFPWLQKLFGKESSEQQDSIKIASGLKMSFWLIVLLALPVILSIILSMLGIAGTHGQELLMQLHRYCSLSLAVIAIINMYLVIQSAVQK